MHCQPPLHLPYTYVLNEQLYLTKHDKQNYRILILPRPLQMKMPPPNCSAFKPKSLLSAFGMTTHPQTHTSSCSLAHVTTSYLVHLVTLNSTVCFCPCSIQLTLNTARGTLLTWVTHWPSLASIFSGASWSVSSIQDLNTPGCICPTFDPGEIYHILCTGLCISNLTLPQTILQITNTHSSTTAVSNSSAVSP